MIIIVSQFMVYYWLLMVYNLRFYELFMVYGYDLVYSIINLDC